MKKFLPLIEENEAQCFEAFTALKSTIHQKDSRYTLMKTDADFWIFNGIFRLRTTEKNINRDIEDWKNYFRKDFGVFSFPQSTPTGLAEKMLGHGFEVGAESTCVVLDTEPLVKTLENFKSDYLEVRDTKSNDMFFRTFGKIFGMPENLQNYMLHWATSYGFDEKLPYQSIYIEQNGSAVAIASYFVTDEIAGIYNIGVLPEYRLRGLGIQISAAIAKLCRERGIRFLFGSGSAEGMNVYRKAPIKEVGTSIRWRYRSK